MIARIQVRKSGNAAVRLAAVQEGAAEPSRDSDFTYTRPIFSQGTTTPSILTLSNLLTFKKEKLIKALSIPVI